MRIASIFQIAIGVIALLSMIVLKLENALEPRFYITGLLALGFIILGVFNLKQSKRDFDE